MTTAIANPATDAQKRYLNSLRVERGYAAIHEDDFADKRATSRAIDQMKAMPVRATRLAVEANDRRPQPGQALGGLPLSKFIVNGDQGQPVHLEVVERRGGRRYVNVLIGSPGDWRRQNVSFAAMVTLAGKIRGARYVDTISGQTLEGPEAAAVRFSREYTCCAACSSPLSDEASILRGLGPVCAGRF